MAGGKDSALGLFVELGYQDLAITHGGRGAKVSLEFMLANAQTAAGPGDQSFRHILGVIKIAEQMIGTVQGDETVGVPGCLVDASSLVDRDDQTSLGGESDYSAPNAEKDLKHACVSKGLYR